MRISQQVLPAAYTCGGEDISPNRKGWTFWLRYNIPPEVRGLGVIGQVHHHGGVLVMVGSGGRVVSPHQLTAQTWRRFRPVITWT